jgi:putative hemolysin
MTPRVDVMGLDLDALPENLGERLLEVPYKCLLLYRGDMDHVEGFLDVRKFLLDPTPRIESARLPPFFVPETAPLNRLLADFQRHRVRAAVVVDEYGGTAGLVTRGDILEEITGDIYDELGRPRPLFQEAGPHRWLVDPTLSLDDLNRRLRLDLEAEGADRLAGWIAHHLGRLPEEGDVVETQGVRVTVLKAEKARLLLAQIEKVAGKIPARGDRV